MCIRDSSKAGVLLDTAVDLDIVEKAGSWYSYGDEKLGQGRENVKTMLEEDAELARQIDEKVRAAFKKDLAPIEEEDGEEEATQESILDQK